MINRFMNMAFGAFIRHFLQQKVRKGSIQAVKYYITAVKFVRFGIMGLFGLGVAASILVSGIVLMIVGIVGLLPIEAQSVAITVLVIGLVLALLSAFAMLILFSQRRWLEMSKSYEMMDAALAPWKGMMPPNPVDVLKGRGPHPGVSLADAADAVRIETERPSIASVGASFGASPVARPSVSPQAMASQV